MPNRPYTLRCISCKSEHEESESCTRCLKCHDPLEVQLDYTQIKKRLNLYALKHAPISALKYLNFYPICDWERLLSLGEGGTPLHLCKNLGELYGIDSLYIKNETANPTGVFKDRGTLVEIAKVLEMKAKAVCLASTGNMAASVSAYCTLAKIPCYVLVPEGTPIGKLAQTLSYGARIIQVRGTYSECALLAEKMSEKYGFYLAGDYAFRLEGQKSLGIEIAEQLGWKAPDYVLCPIGCGTNLSAIWKGFWELKELGLIESLPKLIGVQAKNCNPLVEAFKKGHSSFKEFKKPQTICSAVQVSLPLDGKKVLSAIYASKGMILDVDDESALEAEQLLAKKEAIFVEPSGALPLAAFLKLQKRAFFKKKEIVVLIGTGNGLKDPHSAVKILPDPPSIDARMEEVDRYLKSKVYEMQPVSLRHKERVLWKKTPSLTQLKKEISDEFALTLKKEVLEAILSTIQEFEYKGKKVTHQDLQNILEEHLDEYNLTEKVLEIIHFEAKIVHKQKAEGKIEIKLDGKSYHSKAKGTGAVDALIQALNKSLKGHDRVKMQLTDYLVEIFSPGVAANVKVIIKAKDSSGNKAMGQGVSPDVIAASIHAYEKCYNFLYARQNNKK